MEGWIPVTERLPEHENDVLVTVFNSNKPFVTIDCYMDGDWYERYDGVTTWMEMSEPYEVKN